MNDEEKATLIMALNNKLQDVVAEFIKENELSQSDNFHVLSEGLSMTLARITYTIFKKTVSLDIPCDYIWDICKRAKDMLKKVAKDNGEFK